MGADGLDPQLLTVLSCSGVQSQRVEPRMVRRGVLIGLLLVAVGTSACDPSSTSNASQLRTLEGATTRFAVIGDYGTGDETERDVAAQVKRWSDNEGADALVTTGDNAYPYSTPDALEEVWTPFYGWAEDEISVIATLGNHDIQDDGGQSTVDFFGMSGAWYRTTINNVDFLVLDANRPEGTQQTEWLRASLAQSQAIWKVVVFHQPAFSCSQHDGDPRIVERWVPLFDEFRVDLVLSSHDHNYQRFTVGSTAYVVSGGGGADLYALDDCPEGSPQRLAANDQKHHFLSVEAADTEMLIQVIDTQGRVLDSFSLLN